MLKALLTLMLALSLSGQAWAHFGMLIPSRPTVTNQAEATLTFNIAFAHPMERTGMNMARPKAFTVVKNGQVQDLTSTLSPATYLSHQAWTAAHTLTSPGLYQFCVEPQPYFEPAEDCFITHYTKVVVPAFGVEDGWHLPVGLRTEIVPLTRPFGNYAGNVVQGSVLLDGKPVPHGTVEVEYCNADGKRTAPNEYYVTQVVTTDANGVFTFAVPWPGWWGFAALNTAPEQREHNGTPKEVELGAVLWMYFAGSEQ